MAGHTFVRKSDARPKVDRFRAIHHRIAIRPVVSHRPMANAIARGADAAIAGSVNWISKGALGNLPKSEELGNDACVQPVQVIDDLIAGSEREVFRLLSSHRRRSLTGPLKPACSPASSSLPWMP